MNVVILDQSELQDCSFGCPVEVYRILKDGWDEICETGSLNTTCTPEQTINIEIQPANTDNGGESITCQVNGITADVEYQFWYEPKNNVLLTTPKSKFITNSFDSTAFSGGWTVIRWLGCDWFVVNLKNDTGACDDPCGEIVCQRGMIIPMQDCFSVRDTRPIRDEDYCIEDDDDWIPIE